MGLPSLGVDLAGPSAARWRVYCSALSSACAMATVLTTWSDLPLFTDLQCALQAARAEPVTEPFSEAVGPPGRYFADLVVEFASCGDAMVQRLVGALAAAFCPPVAKGYAAALLDTMRALHDPTGRLSVEEIAGLVCTVSPVIHTAALDLAAHLSFLAAHVTSDRFGMLWRGLAAELDAFLFRHLSTHPALQRLSYAQARQFRVDVEGLALLLFGPFSRHPKAHLGTCQQAAAVLTLHPVERQEVLRCLQEEDPAARAEGRAQLQTRGVTGLTEDQLRGLLRAVH